MTAKQYDLQAVIESENKKNPPIEITAGKKTFLVPPMILWSDAAFEAAKAEDVVGAAKMVLGKDYDAFTAAGGTAALLFIIVKQSQRASVPE